MILQAIIKKGTKDDPKWMVHKEGWDEEKDNVGIILDYEDDNLPVFQPFPEYISKEDLDKFDCELVDIEIKIL